MIQMELFSAKTIEELINEIAEKIDSENDINEKINILNSVRSRLHDVSPFRDQPVDCVVWVRNETVHANDYNPNSVAPPEMELLKTSIRADGYTQPIVSMPHDGVYEVIDGFHRHRVGKEDAEIQQKIMGYLPLVQIRTEQSDKTDRMASTIRHNRARGKHKVEAMSDIVIELKRRNWSDEKIAKNLGMDADEVLRLCQITGLSEAFKDHEFSEAWEVTRDDDTFTQFSDSVTGLDIDDKGRVYHTYEKWECYKAGFFAERCVGFSKEEGEEIYKSFLSDMSLFEDALNRVISEWKYSCEHNLTNERMNRIAWLGQASVCYAKKIPSMCRGGFNMLSEEQKTEANNLALKYLNKWLTENSLDAVTYEQAGGRTEAELY